MSFKKYALCNAALSQDVEAEIRAEHPSWNDKKVEKELRKVQKIMTMYNKFNTKEKMKRQKKPKEK